MTRCHLAVIRKRGKEMSARLHSSGEYAPQTKSEAIGQVVAHLTTQDADYAIDFACELLHQPGPRRQHPKASPLLKICPMPSDPNS